MLARWGEAAGSSGWFIWGSSGPSQLVPLAEERARGDEAGARRARGTRRTAHIFIVDVSSAVDQLTDLRVVPVKCGIEQVGHLRFREPLY